MYACVYEIACESCVMILNMCVFFKLQTSKQKLYWLHLDAMSIIINFVIGLNFHERHFS